MNVPPDSGWGEVAYNKWITFVRDAVECYDFDKSQFRVLPYNAGYYEQGPMLDVWQFIMSIYKSVLQDDNFMDYLRKRNARS